MKQSLLPKFVSVVFHPGHNFEAKDQVFYRVNPRYVALGEDGRAYSYVLTDPSTPQDGWHLIG
jgi:hypothetical protein